MNFKKEPGDRAKYILEIIQDDLKGYLFDKIGFNRKGMRELEEDYKNNSATFLFRNKYHDNITYSVAVKKLEHIEFAGKKMIDAFAEEVGNNLVSFRNHLEIQENTFHTVEEGYLIFFRAAIINGEPNE